MTNPAIQSAQSAALQTLTNIAMAAKTLPTALQRGPKLQTLRGSLEKIGSRQMDRLSLREIHLLVGATREDDEARRALGQEISNIVGGFVREYSGAWADVADQQVASQQAAREVLALFPKPEPLPGSRMTRLLRRALGSDKIETGREMFTKMATYGVNELNPAEARVLVERIAPALGEMEGMGRLSREMRGFIATYTSQLSTLIDSARPGRNPREADSAGVALR